MSNVMTRRGFLGFAAAAAAVAGGSRFAVAHNDQNQQQGMGTPMAGATPGAMMGGGMMGGSGTGAAFFTVTNNGAEDDRLVAAASDVAAAVEIHEMAMKDGTMQMSPLMDGLPIPAGETVVLEPGGYHIMLIGLKQDLKAGETFKMTVTFEKAGEVELEVPIFATKNAATAAELPSVTAGDLVIEKIWARHAPALMTEATPMPEASPSS
jgi:copper(I)-binding protein